VPALLSIFILLLVYFSGLASSSIHIRTAPHWCSQTILSNFPFPKLHLTMDIYDGGY